MRADAQFAVVEAVIKGFNKWVEAHGKAPQEDVSLLVKLSPYRR
jgi:exportin-5